MASTIACCTSGQGGTGHSLEATLTTSSSPSSRITSSMGLPGLYTGTLERLLRSLGIDGPPDRPASRLDL